MRVLLQRQRLVVPMDHPIYLSIRRGVISFLLGVEVIMPRRMRPWDVRSIACRRTSMLGWSFTTKEVDLGCHTEGSSSSSRRRCLRCSHGTCTIISIRGSQVLALEHRRTTSTETCRRQLRALRLVLGARGEILGTLQAPPRSIHCTEHIHLQWGMRTPCMATVVDVSQQVLPPACPTH